MSKKNIYFYKLDIIDNQSKKAVPVGRYKTMLSEIFDRECHDDSIELTYQQTEPIWMDVLENTDEYLFARISRKRLNNSIQKRNYQTGKTADVLSPAEAVGDGVECFTYCILGYAHGVLSVVKAKGAPGPETFGFLFARHNREYTVEYNGIPNKDLITELIDGKAPQVNRIMVDIALPSAVVLEQMFGFDDEELVSAMHSKTASLTIDVKPNFRESLMNDPDLIARLVNALRKDQNKYNTIKITGKKDGNGPQREYDLYEEYFKYPVGIKEYRQSGGRKVEATKIALQKEYHKKMTQAYD